MPKPPPIAPTSGPSGTQAIARAAALLRALATHGQTGYRLADLARYLQMERPTVHRILRRLVEERLVQQDARTRTYRLGPLIYELGLVVDPPAALQACWEPSLDVVAQHSGDTVFAFVPASYDVVCIDRREGHYPVKALLLSVGRRRPLGTAAGSLAMLARLPPDEAERILQYNAVRLEAMGEDSPPALMKRIEQVRHDGYALKHPLDMQEILSLSMAVCDAVGRPQMAISISALTYRIRDRLDMLVPLLRRETQAISRRLATHAGAGLVG